MTQNEFLKAIADALGVSVEQVTMQSSQSDLENWDSLGHLTILQALDEKTNGRLDAAKGVGTSTTAQSLWNSLSEAGLTTE